MSPLINAEGLRRDIVVVGASAGGVLALRDLLAKLPAELDAAVAIVLHRSAVVESHLARVLAWRSQIPVVEPVDGAILAPRHAYVAPRDHHLRIEGTTLRLARGPKEHFCRPAIDPLFRSAAASHGKRVVGILMSGMGDDGVSGLIAISAAGGVSLVQAPDEAAYPQMPRSGIISDQVQAALAVADIAETIAALARGEAVASVSPAP